MQRQFIDLDDKIESTSGMTIAALFEENIKKFQVSQDIIAAGPKSRS